MIKQTLKVVWMGQIVISSAWSIVCVLHGALFLASVSVFCGFVGSLFLGKINQIRD